MLKHFVFLYDAKSFHLMRKAPDGHLATASIISAEVAPLIFIHGRSLG